MKPIIIGISGATSAGKTTIAHGLQRVLSHITTIGMDRYYWAEDSKKHTMLAEFNYEYANWEVLSSVDFKTMMKDICLWKEAAENDASNKRILIVEGILILNHSELSKLCTQKYFIALDKEVCWERRKNRYYEPRDPEGYFDKICWPEYLRNKNDLSDQPDIAYLDGLKSCEELENLIKSNIQQLL